MYLHEIGRVHLLTAVDEKLLAKKMENGKHISRIRKTHLERYGRTPSATEIILDMLRELGHSADVIRALQKQLKIKGTDKFRQTICEPRLREEIDGELDQQLVREISDRIGEPLPDTEQILINLSINILYNLLIANRL